MHLDLKLRRMKPIIQVPCKRSQVFQTLYRRLDLLTQEMSTCPQCNSSENTASHTTILKHIHS